MTMEAVGNSKERQNNNNSPTDTAVVLLREEEGDQQKHTSDEATSKEQQKDEVDAGKAGNKDCFRAASPAATDAVAVKREEQLHEVLEAIPDEKLQAILTSPESDTGAAASVAHTVTANNDQTATKSPLSIEVNALPDNILSPPKSESQTDGTNTATSSSPASEAQLSPVAQEAAPSAAEPTAATDKGVSKPINVVANGIIPNAGKPFMSALSSARSMRQRKVKPTVAMYESEISDHKMGIKLCIKKSETASCSAGTGSETCANKESVSENATYTKASAGGKSATRKRSRKSKTKPRLDSDDSEYESKRKKLPGGATGSSSNATEVQPVEQSDFGARIPEEILYKIFQLVVEQAGTVPTLIRLGRVCSLWRRVSLQPALWKGSMDLSTWVREKYRTEAKLKWLIDNRCRGITDLNMANWKVFNTSCVLEMLAAGCPNLASITLAGWKNLTAHNLLFLVEKMPKLQRLDLSSVNLELNSSKSAVGLNSLCQALQVLKERLTHLYLAHNRLAGIPQIVNTLSTMCPNLTLLDLSNVHTQATSHGILHIEKLQHGCQKLKVLRVTNSHVTLSQATMQEMMDSPGFPQLEELAVAALTDESRILGDDHLQRILKTSSKLKLLDVRNCIRLTHTTLIRLPAWDLKHLFLSGCSLTRDVGSGLELIASKWAHSLTELDLAWSNVQETVNNALRALAEKGSESPLAHLNLCGSSVSEEAVKEILANCPQLSSINLSSCRGLPRGVKRLMQGPRELQELREVLKVQMKVKLPAEEKQQTHASDMAATTHMEVDSGSGANDEVAAGNRGSSGAVAGND